VRMRKRLLLSINQNATPLHGGRPAQEFMDTTPRTARQTTTPPQHASATRNPRAGPSRQRSVPAAVCLLQAELRDLLEGYATPRAKGLSAPKHPIIHIMGKL